VATGLARGIRHFVVPAHNLAEARALGDGLVYGVRSLSEAVTSVVAIAIGEPPETREPPDAPACAGVDGTGTPGHRGATVPTADDFSDIRGHRMLKEALTVAAAGRHHVLLFGPPGGGKSMAARRFPGLLPDLTRRQALAVTRLHSLAGTLPDGVGLLRRPPLRAPHHSASTEGIIGGGRDIRPGEASLAHLGVLFLDEAAEYRMGLLQSLREPAEEGVVTIVRAGANHRLPADFQLLLATNACPCGNLGRDEAACLCTEREVHRYWRRLGAPLMDRIDIRIPVIPVPPEQITGDAGPGTAEMRAAVSAAREFRGEARPHQDRANSRIRAGELQRLCPLDADARQTIVGAARKLGLSSRACHAAIRVARTVADLEGSARIRKDHVLQAVQLRRFGDNELFWRV
jgi:magnesium chelatase family protein